MTSRKRFSRLTSRLIRKIGDCIAPAGLGEGKVCIVNYHRILESPDPLLKSEPDIETFRWQMKVLAECFNVIPLNQAIHTLQHGSMPPRSVCITFDDGYRSIHDLALPVLKEFNLPATVFVTTGYIDDTNMWNDRILGAVRRLPKGKLDLEDAGLGSHDIQSIEDRVHVVHQLTENAKYLAPEKRLELTRKLEQLAGEVREPGLMLTREMIRTLAREGIEIGAHTVSHPILTRLDDSTAYTEIAEGKQQLEDLIGKPVPLFAYPNGKAGMDFDERHVAMAKQAGFAAAFTTTTGAASRTQDQFQYPRSRPWDSTPFFYALRLLRWLAR